MSFIVFSHLRGHGLWPEEKGSKGIIATANLLLQWWSMLSPRETAYSQCIVSVAPLHLFPRVILTLPYFWSIYMQDKFFWEVPAVKDRFFQAVLQCVEDLAYLGHFIRPQVFSQVYEQVCYQGDLKPCHQGARPGPFPLYIAGKYSPPSQFYTYLPSVQLPLRMKDSSYVLGGIDDHIKIGSGIWALWPDNLVL